MESTLIPFSFETMPVRVLDQCGEPWFVATDVCAALGFGNPRQALQSHVDDDDVQKLDAIDGMGRVQPTNCVNEPGLYALIMGSTKESARRFKRWVTHEVLPAIRRTGRYDTGRPEPDSSQKHAINMKAHEVTSVMFPTVRNALYELVNRLQLSPERVRQIKAHALVESGLLDVGVLTPAAEAVAPRRIDRTGAERQRRYRERQRARNAREGGQAPLLDDIV